MNIFVTGASGFVGTEILKQLQQAGCSTRILARQHSCRQIASHYNAEVISGDIVRGAPPPESLKGIDAVIHLVGIISEIGANTFENVHTLGTRNVVNAAAQAGVRRFVHMSALGARAGAHSRYHQSKWAAEEIVRSSGLDYTIFRPSIIYGPGDGFVNLFDRMARFSPALPIFGDGKSKLRPIPVSEVAACFVKALTEPASINQTYDLCGLEVLSYEEILRAVVEVTGRKRWTPHVPMSIARTQAAFLEFIFPKILGKAAPLNRDQLIMLAEDNVGNPEPANSLFRLKPVAFKEGIAAFLKRAS